LEEEHDSTRFAPICDGHKPRDATVATDVRFKDVHRVGGVQPYGRSALSFDSR
jgi:hypothetical protein